MSTVPVVLTDSTTHDFSVVQLTTEQVFRLVREGVMNWEQFEEWRDQLAFERYADGYSDGMQSAGG